MIDESFWQVTGEKFVYEERIEESEEDNNDTSLEIRELEQF